jgi:hypothetical protein
MSHCISDDLPSSRTTSKISRGPLCVSLLIEEMTKNWSESCSLCEHSRMVEGGQQMATSVSSFAHGGLALLTVSRQRR